MTESRVQMAQAAVSAMLTRPDANGDRKMRKGIRLAEYRAATMELLSARAAESTES